MIKLFAEYSDLWSVVFIGLSGGVVGLIFEKERLNLKAILIHIFTGILAANYLGNQICLWRDMEYCDFARLISATTAVPFFLFITGAAKDILLHRTRLIRTVINKYVKNNGTSNDSQNKSNSEQDIQEP